MSERNKIRIEEIVVIPGRNDKAVVIEVISGSLNAIRGHLICPSAFGKWRITNIAHHEPESGTMTNMTRYLIGIEACGEAAPLRAGMELLEE